MNVPVRLSLLLPAAALTVLAALPLRADDWYAWRGPAQDGRSAEKYAANSFQEEPLWVQDVYSRGAPVVAGGRVFLFGYRGEGATMAETLSAFDEKTGKLIWEARFPDFLTDNAYSRYAIGSPTVDPETGNVYLLSTAGELAGFDRDGKTLWRRSLMEEVGRLSFPNGRTGSPMIIGELVIARGITANWGGDGPARDRFYAFRKDNGTLVWSSTPGLQPKDSSFSTAVFAMRDGAPVMYVTTGCGHFLAMNPLTGEAQWRFKASKGGINASPVLVDGMLIAAHDKENLDSTDIGRLAAVRIPEGELPPGTPEDPVPNLPATAEAWRLPISAESSTPVVADGLLFQVGATGVLYCVDPATGAELWELKLGPGNLHSSPAWVNGRLYVPIYNDVASDNGILYVIEPTREKGEIAHRVRLDGFCLGAPGIANGRLYVATTKHLYAFRIAEGEVSGKNEWFRLPEVTPGPAVALQAMPREVTLHPGDAIPFAVRSIDARGYPVAEVADPAWESWIPPTARVKSTLDAAFDSEGRLAAAADAGQSAGAFRVTSDGLTGVIRGRVLPGLPLREDFESAALSETSAGDSPVAFSYPPLPWIGGRFKWEIRDHDGNKVLYKTLENVFFQRATTFIGSPEMRNYTAQADVMTDGNRRLKSDVGLINQRYLITLKGNSNELDVSSNHERLKVAVRYPVSPKQWYTLKTRVDVADDGSGVIRAKVWPKGDAEPEEWTLEVPHEIAHRQGAPGLFGFAFQSRHAVYIDNIAITPND